jgi:hypothetical protein
MRSSNGYKLAGFSLRPHCSFLAWRRFTALSPGTIRRIWPQSHDRSTFHSPTTMAQRVCTKWEHTKLGSFCGSKATARYFGFGSRGKGIRKSKYRRRLSLDPRRNRLINRSPISGSFQTNALILRDLTRFDFGWDKDLINNSMQPSTLA